MLDQERNHLNTFDRMISENRVRPTIMRPLWNVAGTVLGAGTALLGKEGAMMCTEAVETVIGEHYNDQIRKLHQLQSELSEEENEEREQLGELIKTIKRFRDEELEHLDHAVANDSRKAPMYTALSGLIQGGCKAAIWISERI